MNPGHLFVIPSATVYDDLLLYHGYAAETMSAPE
jgi:hypothetical protein